MEMVVCWLCRRPPGAKDNGEQRSTGRNIDGSLALTDEVLSDKPLLLVDYMVDSRWTFTLAAWLLCSNGGSEVWPLALAQVGS